MAKKPTKRKVSGGRVTPKTTSAPHKTGATPGSLASKARTPKKTADHTLSANAEEAKKKPATAKDGGRYTAPIPKEYRVSPTWVPVLMFVLLGAGSLLIFLNYLGLFGDPSNILLVGGLGLILGGIIVATQYH